jgi:DNA-binding response OmpR family regulator
MIGGPRGVLQVPRMETYASHVLVADEDAESRGQVCTYLGQHDLRVTPVNSGREMLEIIRREPVDLLLLEPQLDGAMGIALTGRIRETSKLPIVVLSGLNEEADRVMGLELGADDYVTKPCSLRELLARIRAVLRRSRMQAVPMAQDESLRAYRFAGWELNVKLHRLLCPAGQNVRLSRGEYSLLCAFLSSPQRILTRDQLLDLSRLHSTEVYDRSIDVQIMRLRRKIESDPAHPGLIRTERGAGYLFDAPVKTIR